MALLSLRTAINFGRNGEESLLRSVKDSSLSFLPKLMMSANKLWAVKRSQLAEGDSPQLISTHHLIAVTYDLPGRDSVLVLYTFLSQLNTIV